MQRKPRRIKENRPKPRNDPGPAAKTSPHQGKSGWTPRTCSANRAALRAKRPRPRTCSEDLAASREAGLKGKILLNLAQPVFTHRTCSANRAAPVGKRTPPTQDLQRRPRRIKGRRDGVGYLLPPSTTRQPLPPNTWQQNMTCKNVHVQRASIAGPRIRAISGTCGT